MSRVVGASLSPEVRRRLAGDPASKGGNVILLTTLDSRGWPHAAMLSSWEVFAKDRARVRIATYDSSTTTKNLMRDGKATLLLIDRGITYYIKGKATSLRRHARCDPSNSIFELKIARVLEDKLPGATITSGITYEKGPGVEPHEKLFEELKS